MICYFVAIDAGLTKDYRYWHVVFPKCSTSIVLLDGLKSYTITPLIGAPPLKAKTFISGYRRSALISGSKSYGFCKKDVKNGMAISFLFDNVYMLPRLLFLLIDFFKLSFEYKLL